MINIIAYKVYNIMIKRYSGMINKIKITLSHPSPHIVHFVCVWVVTMLNIYSQQLSSINCKGNFIFLFFFSDISWVYFFLFIYYVYFMFIYLFIFSYMRSQTWTPLPPPSPQHLSGSSPCTCPKQAAPYVRHGLAIQF